MLLSSEECFFRDHVFFLFRNIMGGGGMGGGGVLIEYVKRLYIFEN